MCLNNTLVIVGFRKKIVMLKNEQCSHSEVSITSLAWSWIALRGLKKETHAGKRKV